jgi:hypothetical protein
VFDLIGVGFKDGIDFFSVGDLLPLEHATPRLINYILFQRAVVVDLFAELADDHVVEQAFPV